MPRGDKVRSEDVQVERVAFAFCMASYRKDIDIGAKRTAGIHLKELTRAAPP